MYIFLYGSVNGKNWALVKINIIIQIINKKISDAGRTSGIPPTSIFHRKIFIFIESKKFAQG